MGRKGKPGSRFIMLKSFVPEDAGILSAQKAAAFFSPRPFERWEEDGEGKGPSASRMEAERSGFAGIR